MLTRKATKHKLNKRPRIAHDAMGGVDSGGVDSGSVDSGSVDSGSLVACEFINNPQARSGPARRRIYLDVFKVSLSSQPQLSQA